MGMLTDEQERGGTSVLVTYRIFPLSPPIYRPTMLDKKDCIKCLNTSIYNILHTTMPTNYLIKQ